MQIEQSPTVEISQVSEREIQVTVSYIDVKLSITGRKDNVIACLTQRMFDPSATSDLVRQIQSQIGTQME